MNKLVIVILSAFLGSVAPQLVLGQGDAAAGQAKSALCATCHGADGNSILPENPKLAGQNASYIIKQINDYKSGDRANLVMTGMVAALSDQDIADIAAWYASQQVTLQGADPESCNLVKPCTALELSSYLSQHVRLVIHQTETVMRLPDFHR
ncbi:MAG: hypothetical protein CM1200mP40_36330 [Gammaproteobacteria bacterium]|nr:MAG: hypothetical protein CM1200mP40_36330 [Gammaproteobacteria bacterium]